MSDFYEGRMIPLKLADQAIISCNKEIEKLQIENARLKAEVDRLNDAIMRGASIPDAKPTE